MHKILEDRINHRCTT